MSKDPQAPPLPAGDPQRSRIASIAARLMAEDGIDSFSTAKRKAALSLGLPENARLPDDTEVEAELRLYQRLFQDEEQTERIAYLRQKALDFMAIVQPFNPYLTGSVLDGTAGRYAAKAKARSVATDQGIIGQARKRGSAAGNAKGE